MPCRCASAPRSSAPSTCSAANPARSTTGDVIVAQALADVATIALLQHRTAVAAEVVNQQLTGALNSRILIEQAKGILAERHQLDMETAFSRLRTYARNNNQLLSDLAQSVVHGSMDLPFPANPP